MTHYVYTVCAKKLSDYQVFEVYEQKWEKSDIDRQVSMKIFLLQNP